MKIKLDIKKSLENNADLYFNKSKKFKKKVQGAKEAIERSYKKLDSARKEAALEKQDIVKVKEEKKEWFEKFRWFRSSEGFLVVGGRDSTTNEIIIKKHTDKGDIVFHTEVSGSPFFVIKSEKKKPGKDTLNETGQAAASFSRAWKGGFSSAEVFYVDPSQVSKEAKAGEYLAKGAFMIYGKKNIIKSELKVAAGIVEGKVTAGPLDSMKKNCKKIVVLVPGSEKVSSAAKKIQKKIGGDLDDIIRVLPVGGSKIIS
jgi:predicted ribosome quality control (RQC) complex YloA/Tae2 family protein